MTTQTLTTYYCQFCDMVAGFFKARVANYRHQRNVRSGINQLNAMTDLELRDIGISRCDIVRVASGQWGRPEKF